MRWRGLPAPVAPLGEPGITVTGLAMWGIRFATPEYGFVFGNAAAAPGHLTISTMSAGSWLYYSADNPR